MTNAVLPEPVFRQLRDFIYEKSGIFIPDTKKYLLEKKLQPRLAERNLGGFEDYLPFLRYSANGDEMNKLFDAVTTRETYFFREPQQFQMLTDVLVPQVLAGKATRDLRIWSSASSTGEEPYTIAMVLMEKTPGLRFELAASDISGEALDAARKAAYGSYSIRNVPPPYLAKYFVKKDWVHELAPAVRNTVKFHGVNLVDGRQVRAMQGMDIIFCRNVLIYFDEKAKKTAVGLLYDCLRPGGFLIIGSSESLHNVTRAFKPIAIDRVIAYQRA